MLQSFGDDIWLADGPETVVAGFRYPTRMAVIRLPGRSLFIWSPVALSDALRAAVDALGQVDHIVAPNSLHHLFLGEWQAATPGFMRRPACAGGAGISPSIATSTIRPCRFGREKWIRSPSGEI
jgi:hypothetical protein